LRCGALGNAEAMYNLGWMYANGRGVARDDAYAATLFEMAMFKGHPGAEKGRRLAGEYTGAVPDCLKPRWRYAFAATRENWDTQKYLASLPERKKRVVELITTLAPRFSIEPRLALAIATTESNFDERHLAQERHGRDAADPRDGQPFQREEQLRSGGEHQGRPGLSALAAGLLSGQRGARGGRVQRR
jgi:hypothetical protein